MTPCVGARNRVSRLKTVVLPAPFGPMSAWIAPRRRRSDTSFTARTPANSFDRCRVSSRTSLAMSECPRAGRGLHNDGTAARLPVPAAASRSYASSSANGDKPQKGRDCTGFGQETRLGGSAMKVTRRQFVKYAAGGLGTTSLVALGFSPKKALAEVRQFKLAHTSETRNTCPYCAVGCGIIMYSLGDGSKNATSEIIHIEGDPDHPVNRCTLCPKGAALLDFVHSPSRLKFPEYRGPGETAFKRVSWDWALDRIARLMKDDRDRNFTQRNDKGLTVNRWTTTGLLAASASSNEAGYITQKVVRALGMA